MSHTINVSLIGSIPAVEFLYDRMDEAITSYCALDPDELAASNAAWVVTELETLIKQGATHFYGLTPADFFNDDAIDPMAELIAAVRRADSIMAGQDGDTRLSDVFTITH